MPLHAEDNLDFCDHHYGLIVCVFVLSSQHKYVNKQLITLIKTQQFFTFMLHHNILSSKKKKKNHPPKTR
jgi:hypothetical protein